MKYRNMLTMLLTAAMLTVMTGCSKDAAEHSESEQTASAQMQTTAESAGTEETGATRKVSLDGKPVETFPTAVPLPSETTQTPTETETTAAPAETAYPDFSDAALKRYAFENSETRFVNCAYPEFGTEMEHADAVNSIIREFAEELIRENTSVSTWTTKDEPAVFDLTWGADAPCTEESDALVSFNADYTITRIDEKYISILFKSDYYMLRAAYPFTDAQGLVIDMQTLKAVPLADLYTVDEAFAAQVQLSAKQGRIPSLADKLGVPEDMIPAESGSPSLEKLTEANTSARTQLSVFMCPDSLGFILPTLHAMGDYYELTIPYEELEQFAK